MKMYLQLQDNGRIITLGSTRSTDRDIEYDIPNDHEVLKNPFVFRYQEGCLVKDTAYQEQLVREKQQRKALPTVEQKLEAIQQALDELILGGWA